MNGNLKVAKELLKVARQIVADEADGGLDFEWLKKNGYKMTQSGYNGIEYEHDILNSDSFRLFHWLVGGNDKVYLAVYLKYKGRSIKLSLESQDLNSANFDELQKKANETAKSRLNEFISKL